MMMVMNGKMSMVKTMMEKLVKTRWQWMKSTSSQREMWLWINYVPSSTRQDRIDCFHLSMALRYIVHCAKSIILVSRMYSLHIHVHKSMVWWRNCMHYVPSWMVRSCCNRTWINPWVSGVHPIMLLHPVSSILPCFFLMIACRLGKSTKSSRRVWILLHVYKVSSSSINSDKKANVPSF